MMKKLTLTTTALCLIGFTAYAQDGDSWDNGDTWDDPYSYDGNGGGTFDDANTTEDSAATEDWGDWDESGFESSGYQEDYVRSARPKFERNPYERFTGIPYDSATELITYVAIVEVLTPEKYLEIGGIEFDTEDSLYARGMKWMISEFGAKQVKKMIEEAGLDPKREGRTIIARAQMPLIVEVNEFQNVDGGKIQFDIELRFKDQRYRYKFTNIVHVEQDLGGEKEDIETYMEYYLDAKKNIVRNDNVLIATNTQINTLIDNLKRTCSRAPFVDDDDW